MPMRDKMGDEKIFGHPQASVQTLNVALTVPLRLSYERVTIAVKIRHLTNGDERVNVEHPHVCFRHSE
jgi:hypothetical protein